MTHWLTGSGLLLTVVGVLITWWGVEGLAESLGGRLPWYAQRQALRRVGRWAHTLGQWFWRVILRRKPRSQTVHLEGTAIGFGVSGFGDVTVTTGPRPPTHDLTLDTLKLYADEVWNAAQSAVADEREARIQQDRKVAGEVSEALKDEAIAIRQEIAELRTLIGGLDSEGRNQGFFETALGLLLTALGGALQFVGWWIT